MKHPHNRQIKRIFLSFLFIAFLGLVYSPKVLACLGNNVCLTSGETCCSGHSEYAAFCGGPRCADSGASNIEVSTITTTATKIPNTFNIGQLLTGGGFNLLNFVFILVGLFFFANLIMAGWDFMMSSGDAKKVSGATTRLMNGVIGLIMTMAAFIIVRLITNILGLGNLV